MNRRGLLLTAVLASTLLLALRAPGEPGGQNPGSVVPARKAPVPTPAGAGPAGQASTAPRFPDLAGNLFPSQTWRPPPPPPPKVKPLPPPPPPPPEPPPFPFTYFGRWSEENKEVVFLKRGEQLIRVKAGDVVNGAWRMDRVDKSGLVFTYLPLNMQKTLGIGR